MNPNQQNDPFAWMSAPAPPPAQQRPAAPQNYYSPPPQQQPPQQQPQQQQASFSWSANSSFHQPPPPQQSWPAPQQQSWSAPQQSWNPPPQQQQQQQQQYAQYSQSPFPAAPVAAPPPAPVAGSSSNDWSNDPWSSTTQPYGVSNTSSSYAAPARTASWGQDPFAVNAGGSSSKLNTSSNPFDVTNDDAGFFSSFSKPAVPQQQQSGGLPPPAPPSAKTQRLLRVASMLFERGALIRADKILIQELLLKQDKRAENALDLAENDGNTDAINRLLYNERSGHAGAEDYQASTVMKKRPSQAQRRDSDEEEEQTEALPTATYSNEAPHPSAGGYSAPVPATMTLDASKQQFTGQILVRVSSKMMFRKWKPCFFCVDRNRVVLYEDKSQWLSGTGSPRMVIPLHECMWIAKPSVKKTYSLIDDGRRVYFSTIKENSPQVLYAVTASGMPKPTAYSPAIEARVVAKFASHYPDEISAFAHSVYSVVLLRQREAKAAAAAGGGGNNNASFSRPSMTRASSGFANRN